VSLSHCVCLSQCVYVFLSHCVRGYLSVCVYLSEQGEGEVEREHNSRE